MMFDIVKYFTEHSYNETKYMLLVVTVQACGNTGKSYFSAQLSITKST